MDNTIFKKIWSDNDFFEAKISFITKSVSVSIDTYLTEDMMNNFSQIILLFLDKREYPATFEIGERNDDYPYIKIDFSKFDSHGNAIIEVYIECYSDDYDKRYYNYFPMILEHGLLFTFAKNILKLSNASVDEEISVI